MEKNEHNNRLQRLNDLKDYKVAENDTDIRGWNIYSGNGEIFGKVDELIVDTNNDTVRYLDVELTDEFSGKKGNHILLPIGMARLEEDKEHVIAENLQTMVIAECPRYTGGPVTRAYEKDIRTRLSGDTIRETGDNFYDNEMYDSSRMFGPRIDDARDRTTKGPFRTGTDRGKFNRSID